MAPPIAPAGTKDTDFSIGPIDTSNDTSIPVPVLDQPAGDAEQSCNFDRRYQSFTLTKRDGSTETLRRVLEAKPHDGFRLCGLTFNTHFADEAIGKGLIGGLNLPDLLKGPDYSQFTGDLRLNFTPGAGILMHGGVKAGELSSDTAPGASGHSGLVYLGLDHFSKDQGGDGFGFFDRSSYSLGLGWAHLGDTTVGRLQLKSESDWISYHNSGWRVGMQLFASETNFSFGGGDVSNCKGASCSASDFYAPTTFYPLRLSVSYFFNAPSTADDVYHAPGTKRPIGTEELTYKLSSRYFNEVVGQIRRENVAKLAGVRLAAGTSFQGVDASTDTYTTAGTGMGVFGLIEGWDRGSNAYMLGDFVRNGEWWVLIPEAGLFLAYGIGAGVSKPLPTANQYWEDAEAGSFGDFRGGAAKIGVITQGSQLGLTLLDGFGLLSTPEIATTNPDSPMGAWFHGSNALLGVAGFLGVWFARPIAGNGFGEGDLANTIFRDKAPFFDGSAGTYDPVEKNYPWTQQREYGVHTVGTMFLAYALTREIDFLSYKFDKARAYDEGEVSGANKTGSGPVVRLDLQLGPTGGMFGASGSF